MMLKLNRLFFALWPGEEQRRACDEAARELRLKMQPGGYLSSPERYHITLLFLGDTVSPEAEAAALKAAARVRAAPFALNLELASSFRANKKIPWWLGPRETPPGLTQLYDRVNEAMLSAKVLPERMKFVPHLTILLIRISDGFVNYWYLFFPFLLPLSFFAVWADMQARFYGWRSIFEQFLGSYWPRLRSPDEVSRS